MKNTVLICDCTHCDFTTACASTVRLLTSLFMTDVTAGTQQNEDCVVKSKLSTFRKEKLFLLLFYNIVSTANVMWRRKMHDT
jgi:hypothetical protein